MHLWDVQYMRWERFHRAVAEAEGQDFHILRLSDLIFGGVTFLSNFL